MKSCASRVFLRKGPFFRLVGAEGAGRSGQAASKLPRGPRTAESLRAGRKAVQGVWQRFSQRCMARSDSRSNLTGPTRALHGTARGYSCGIEQGERPYHSYVIPAQAGIHPGIDAETKEIMRHPRALTRKTTSLWKSRIPKIKTNGMDPRLRGDPSHWF